jgi:hypothetical protein
MKIAELNYLLLYKLCVNNATIFCIDEHSEYLRLWDRPVAALMFSFRCVCQSGVWKMSMADVVISIYDAYHSQVSGCN